MAVGISTEIRSIPICCPMCRSTRVILVSGWVDVEGLVLIISKFTVNEADLFDLGCMSPLYASPPHSPSSDVSSPGQQHGEEAAHGGGGGGEGNAKGTSITDNHFTRDTHMRIILGGGKAENGGAQS